MRTNFLSSVEITLFSIINSSRDIENRTSCSSIGDYSSTFFCWKNLYNIGLVFRSLKVTFWRVHSILKRTNRKQEHVACLQRAWNVIFFLFSEIFKIEHKFISKLLYTSCQIFIPWLWFDRCLFFRIKL